MNDSQRKAHIEHLRKLRGFYNGPKDKADSATEMDPYADYADAATDKPKSRIIMDVPAEAPTTDTSLASDLAQELAELKDKYDRAHETARQHGWDFGA